MRQKARIKLAGDKIDSINSYIDEAKNVVSKLGTSLKGPICLPTKRLKINIRKSVCGDGKASFDNYQMKVHKRLIDIDINERVLRKIMKIKIPEGVKIQIKIIEE